MARRHRLQDLSPYTGCHADERIGLDPLAIGWLHHKQPFNTGSVSKQFVQQLHQFCQPENFVCEIPKAQPCAISRKVITMGEVTYGHAEIRVIGEEAIYAAPDLIYHYVTTYQYQPPQAFIDAVLTGPQPSSSEYKALIRTLQS
ncbi:MAG: hypothetical protein AAF633_28950 [Chloroflexota bacterium]